ncbi:MAG: L-histidine N(alpha)-methyltransferase [Alphaproteobacteria bacterium]
MPPRSETLSPAPDGHFRGRVAWTELAAPRDAAADGEEISRGLGSRPKRLPCRFFYDELGSQLFERICRLPEYYLTRTENALLAAVAGEIALRTGACELIELGSGSSIKTQHLLDAYATLDPALSYSAIDVSPTSLGLGAAQLLARYGGLAVHAIVGTYEAGLAVLAGTRDAGDRRPRLLVFLGSTIGNLTEEETAHFLRAARAALKPGDWLLIGTDLEKEPAIIEAAYNDSEGVTAAFNLNILRHINRRFRADFALDRFAHRAFYNRGRRQIEMHLVSLAEQEVRIAALGVEQHLVEGETIETEISRKFALASFAEVLAACGFAVAAAHTDPRHWFGLTLARAV